MRKGTFPSDVAMQVRRKETQLGRDMAQVHKHEAFFFQRQDICSFTTRVVKAKLFGKNCSNGLLIFTKRNTSAAGNQLPAAVISTVACPPGSKPRHNIDNH